jgi:hypothetical protein
LEAYEKKTKCTLLTHPLVTQHSPATPVPPFYPSFTTSSSNLIAVAVAMRDCQIGSNRRIFRQSWSRRWSSQLAIFLESVSRSSSLYVFSPTDVIFSSIGILLLVSFILCPLASAIVTLAFIRRLKM